MKVSYAQLHHPLFLGGKNHGEKLFNRAGLELEYNRTEKELKVTYNNKTQYIPSTNVASYEPWVEEKVEKAAAPMGKIKAQASDPTAHVFAGLGNGKTS